MAEKNYFKYLKDTYGFEQSQLWECVGVPPRLIANLKYCGVTYPRINDEELTKSLNVELLKNTYEYMKTSNKKLIFIWEDVEGYWEDFKHHERIHECCQQAGISEDTIVYLNNDISLNERYDKWFLRQRKLAYKTGYYESKYKTKINMISFPFLMYGYVQDYGELKYPYEIVKYKDRQKLPTKHFMTLMGRKNWFRDKFWNYFEENKDIVNNGYISYLHKKVTLPNSWVDNRKFAENQKELKSSFLKKSILRCESGPQMDNLNSYYQDSYFSVVPETSNGIYASEKTVKALYHGHPFTIFYPAVDMNVKKIGMLQKLKDWGFETFPELFDESYDNLKSSKPHGALYKYHNWYEDLLGSELKLRYETFINDFKKLANKEIKKLHKICESVEDKCIHNRKILMNLKIPMEVVLKQLNIILSKQK